MILWNIDGSENNPVYKAVEVSNGVRLEVFLKSMVFAAIAAKRPFLSQTLLKAFNFHAIACLHPFAGELRPCEVQVGVHRPPQFFFVPSLMDDFVNEVNMKLLQAGSIDLAAFALWKLNFIHPFINGNGRTSRAAAEFLLCVKAGGWVRSKKSLSQVLVEHRPAMIEALQDADKSMNHAPVATLIDSLTPKMEIVPA